MVLLWCLGLGVWDFWVTPSHAGDARRLLTTDH